MAAAGFDTRSSSSSSSLQTPASGTFPSELRSPMAPSPGFAKPKDADLKTPITPPSAYLDFLKSMSPAIMSPAPTTGTSARFSFHDKPSDKGSDKGAEPSAGKPSTSPPTSHPALSRNTSYDSNSSAASGSSFNSTTSSVSGTERARRRPDSPRVTIPPSPFAKPAPRSARTPRRLHIPQSPFSPAVPGSAHSVASPYVSTPLSSTPWSASFESKDPHPDLNSQPGRMSVRQVVTRTVTYCRTPLEPAPNGNLWKRRKIEHDDAAAAAGPKVIDEEEHSAPPASGTASAAAAGPPGKEATPVRELAPGKEPTPVRLHFPETQPTTIKEEDEHDHVDASPATSDEASGAES